MTSSGTYAFQPSDGQLVIDAYARTFGKITKYFDDGRETKFVVYMIINKVNGSYYIGATQKGIKSRSDIHVATAKSGRNERQMIYRAMRKHGVENFKFITIKECVDFWDALESERSYIALLKPKYNMTAGGGGVKGLRHSAASKERMSLAKKGKPSIWSRISMPQEIRDRLADARRSERGKPRSEKSIRAMIATSKLGNAARRRAVICLNTGIEYESCAAAGKSLGIPSARVSHSCNSGAITRKGKLRFSYRDKK